MRRPTTLLIVTVLALAACTAGGDLVTPGTTSTTRPSRPGPPVAMALALQPFDACGDFLDFVQQHALERVGPWGLEGLVHPWLGRGMIVAEDTAFDVAAPGTVRASSSRANVDYSTTNVQEVGIDEPDIVKTDGERIFAIAQGRLYYVDVSTARPRLRGSLRLEQGWNHQLLLGGGRLLVMSTMGRWDVRPVIAPDVWAPHGDEWGEVTVLAEVDVSDPDALRVVRTLYVDGAYLSARMADEVARVVIRSYPTGLEFEYPRGPGLRAERVAEQHNRRVIEESTVDNWLPYYVLEERRGSGTVSREGVLIDCRRAYHPEEFSGLGMLTVLTIDLAKGLEPTDSTGVLADGDTVYASDSGLYVATQRWFDWPVILEEEGRWPEQGVSTQIHKFDISSREFATYRASGEVTGFLLNQWSLSEHDGYLRVASTDQPPWWGWGGERASESLVTVLEERDGELRQVGQVGDLGRGEQIYAVRFMGDVGYVVTFRQVDPLYVIDLRDPFAPRRSGELKIAGYSAYLHPLGEGLLLGVGQDATLEGRTLGTQVSVFDVSDPTRPTRLHKLTVSNGSSEVEWDHHAFLHWAATGLTVLPLTRWSWEEARHSEEYSSGALGLNAGRDGIREVGFVTHQRGKSGSEWPAQIRRALVAGGLLYTVSEDGIEGSDLDTLAEVAWVPFR